MKKFTIAIAALAAVLLCCACTAPDTAYDALHGAGYTTINITGYEFFGCAQDDQFHTGFTAIGPGGASVSGVVCSSFLKGATIRMK